MALRFESDKVILAEVFPNDAHWWYFIHDIPHIDMLPGYALDDLMVVTLEIFDVFIRNTILYEVIMPLKIELPCILNDPFLLEYARALLLLRIGL